MPLSTVLLASLLSAQANDNRQPAQNVREELEVIEDDRKAPGTDTGGLTLEAFQQAFQTRGTTSDARTITALFNKKDANKDGVISHREACGSAPSCQWQASTGGIDLSFGSPGHSILDANDEAE